MNYIEVLKADLEKGYSKADLERLIGLPKNNLSGIIKGDRKLSKKSELKIDKWEASEKPNPLELYLEKTLEENRVGISKTAKDLIEVGIAIQRVSTEGKIERVDPMSEEGFKIQDMAKHQERITKLEEKLKLPPKYLPKWQRTQVEKELSELKSKL